MLWYRNKSVLTAFILSLSLLAASCWRPPSFGTGGHYLDGKMEIIRGRGKGDIDKAITKLEYVVSQDPLYRDSLTLLGRAYYKKGRYKDAFQILKRALTVKPKDEIAWIALGLTQLRLGDDETGLESFKGGLTLLSQASKPGYRGFKEWDIAWRVRNALKRAVFYTLKGLEAKRKIIRSGEILLETVDDEEWAAAIDEDLERRSN